MPEEPEAVAVRGLSHAYGSRIALNDVSFNVHRGEIFSFLGPNGSGKTTLFRILSTLIVPAAPGTGAPGSVVVLGHDVVGDRASVRHLLGVVFQSPSLDRQLTAAENLRHHGHLYGLAGAELEGRIDEMLAALRLSDRKHERVGRFSGGMRRRVELAKGMLTRPSVLLLDEPSTGLDPSARIDLWEYLNRVRRDQGVTVLLTTHLMDEAERCDRLAVLDQGRLLACDSPAALKSRIGGDVITLVVADGQDRHQVCATLLARLNLTAEIVDDVLRIEQAKAHELVPRIIETLPPGCVRSIMVGQPTLEDVFVHLTGHRFRDADPAASAPSSQ